MPYILLSFLFFLPYILFGEKSVCLNMIVKNESQVIERCLTSVLPLIDTWVIVDTGSTDGTQEVIRNFMKAKGVPGELHERPWVNFSHNRNEAMSLAKNRADYLFFIDADEYIVYKPDFTLPALDKDYYYVTLTCPGAKWSKIQLISTKLDWSFVGVLHEVLCPLSSYSYATLEKMVNIYTTEGARSKDPQKYQKDAKILETALLEEPNNARYVFYLARSYENGGDLESALKNFQKRAEMGGWDEEVFWSLLQVGMLQEKLNKEEATVVQSYNKAFQYRRSRLEPLYRLAHYYRDKGNFEVAYAVAKIGTTVPETKDLLLVDQWMYDYGIALELSVAAYWIGKYEECQKISLEILQQKELPENIRDCVQGNLGFANAKLLSQLLKQ